MNPQSDPGFWTSCPSCCNVHQYSRQFANLKLRCPSCRRPFVAVELASPPPVVPGTDMYYCTWGFYPLGFPQGPTPPSNWTPVVPSNDHPSSCAGAGAGAGAEPQPQPVNPEPQPQPVNPEPQPQLVNPEPVKKTTARKKVLVFKPVADGGVMEQQDEEVFTGIDVNEEARVSDLMGDGDGTGGDGSIGFNIDVDVDAAGDDVFGIW